MTDYTIFPWGGIGEKKGYNVEDLAISNVAGGYMVVYNDPSRVKRRLHENDILFKDGKYFKQSISLVEVDNPFTKTVEIALTPEQDMALKGVMALTKSWWYVIVGIIYESGYTPLATPLESCIRLATKDYTTTILCVKVRK